MRARESASRGLGVAFILGHCRASGALPGPCRRKDRFSRAAGEGAPRPLSQPSAFQSRFFTAADGLRLHMRDYGPRASTALPIVCLPGLARTAGDFDPLARALCGSRRVVALDYRGRGLSERDKDWKNYDIMVENADILTVLTGAGIAAAIFVGTSRGGLHIMVTRSDASHSSARRRAQRHRPGDRGQGADAHPRLCRHAASAVVMGRCRRPSESHGERAIHRLGRRRLGGLRPPHVRGTRRPLRAAIRSAVDERASKRSTSKPPCPTSGRSSRVCARFRSSSSAARIPISWRRRPSRKCCAATPVAESHVVPGQGHAPLLRDAATIARIAAFVRMVSGEDEAEEGRCPPSAPERLGWLRRG